MATNLVDALNDVDDEEQSLTVELPSADGEGTDTYTVYPPTTEQLLLFGSAVVTPETSASAVIEIIEDIFSPEDFAVIRKRMRARRGDPARLRINDLSAVIERVMEAKAGFPTTSPSASSSSPTPTGKRSTGRVRPPASTRSGSVSGGS